MWRLSPKILDVVLPNSRKSNSINEFGIANRILALVGFSKTALLKWVLFDLIFEVLSFPENQFFLVGVKKAYHMM